MVSNNTLEGGNIVNEQSGKVAQQSGFYADTEKMARQQYVMNQPISLSTLLTILKALGVLSEDFDESAFIERLLEEK